MHCTVPMLHFNDCSTQWQKAAAADDDEDDEDGGALT